MSQPLVRAVQVRKSYGSNEVLKGIDMEVSAGEVVCLLGPSGSGKTTFLRCINQLEDIQAGRIFVDGDLMGYKLKGERLHRLKDKEIAAQRREIGMVFQRFNLFPHLTAIDNVMEAPVRVQGRPRAEVRAEATELGTTPRGEWKHYRRVEAGEVAGAVVDGRPVGGWLVDVAAVLADRASGVAFTRDLLARTAERTPRLGCFGLHEWAMAYRSDVHGVRHSQLPLRLGAEGTDAVVEGSRIRCTHFDAFRFFAPEARDRNEGDDGVLPTRAGMREMEQPGCLHAGMDLYKWAYKLVPVVDSDLLADCFDLAWDIRRLDMEASPYDLTGVDDLSDGRGGYAAVRIEEPAGRAEYARRQREFAARGQALRVRLLAVLDAAAGAAPGTGPDAEWTSSARP